MSWSYANQLHEGFLIHTSKFQIFEHFFAQGFGAPKRGVVAKKSNRSKKISESWSCPFVFPVAHGSFIDSNDSTRVLLWQLKHKPSLPDMILPGFENFGGFRRFWSLKLDLIERQ